MMTFEAFSEHILRTGDLDPDYIFINNVCKGEKLTDDYKAHWIVAKSVIYNSEAELRYMNGYEEFDTLVYGAERQKSKRFAATYMKAFMAHVEKHANGPLGYFSINLPREANAALVELKKINGVGAWAAWKVLDLISCCLGINIDFSKVDFRVAYEYPLKGMLMLAGESEDSIPKLSSLSYYRYVCDKAVLALGNSRLCKAPPSYTRPINMQEIETLFCKYHSYVHNRYVPGEDLHKLRTRIASSPYPKISALRKYI